MGPVTTRLLVSERSTTIDERTTTVPERFDLAEGLVLEQVGGDLLIAVPGSLETVRLTGDAAKTLLAIHRGVAVDLVEADVRDLIDCGLVVDRSKVSRRGVIRAGAVGLGAGIAVFALPSAAAASSGCVALNGGWEWVEGRLEFLMLEDEEFGILLPRFPSRPLPDGDPSPLSVNLYGEVDFFLLNSDLGVISWRARDVPEPETDVFVGSFTWGEQCYTVTFRKGKFG
jgi:hypothetical protein